MEGNVVLGIHSQVTPETQRTGNAAERFMDGHSWLSLTRDGKTEVYGLWPDNHPRVADNGDGTDIRVGQERRFHSDADRYFELSPEQARKFEAALKGNVTWSPTTTCAGWASDTVTDVTGRRLDATEFMLIETPRELIRTIRELERSQPTTPEKPRAPMPAEQGSSNSLSETSNLSDAASGLSPLYASSVAAVRRLDAHLGRDGDQASACMAGSLACLAKQNGFDRIDHVLLSTHGDQARAGERVFIVQGDPADPAKRRTQMQTQEAIAVPVEESLQRLTALEQAAPLRSQSEQLSQTQDQQAPRRTIA